MFSCEFCTISNNTFFTEHLWATASNFMTQLIRWKIASSLNCCFLHLIHHYANNYFNLWVGVWMKDEKKETESLFLDEK